MPLSPAPQRKCAPLLLLALFGLLAYGNTFNASWQFDDFPNILHNPAVHVEHPTLDAFVGAFYEPGREGMRRPVAKLTFALNWFFHQDDVTGYHVVNFAIHIATAFTLFGAIGLLFRTPRLRKEYSDPSAVFFISLLSAAIWAVHPIQTQAVTYIVQRMASLAAFFYILSVLFYLKARLVDVPLHRRLFFLLCAVSFILAIGTKENVITLPLALFALEMIFFQNLADRRIRNRCLQVLSLLLVFLVALSFIAFHLLRDGSVFSLLQGYETRPFTLAERLRTQPRVLLFHLFQIVYPDLSRYSLMHDFPVSTSFGSPWTTLPAILAMLGLIGFAIFRAPRYSTVSFAILFFFVNHLVESTFIPLEMVFEHRNYLPSMFLFLPISIGVFTLLRRYEVRPAMRGFLVVAFAGFLALLGIATFQRNAVWATEFSLWMDTYQKAPGLSRPAHNLGKILMESGQYAESLALHRKALDLVDMRQDQKALSLFNIGLIYHRMGNISKAVEHYRKAVAIKPDYGKARYALAMLRAQRGEWERAAAHADRLVEYYPKNAKFLSLKGCVLLKAGRVERALGYFKRVMVEDPLDDGTLFYLGVAHHLSGNFRIADDVLSRATRMAPENFSAWFWLMENRIQSGQMEGVARTFQALLQGFPVSRIQSGMVSAVADPFLSDFPFSPELSSFLHDYLTKQAESLRPPDPSPDGPPPVIPEGRWLHDDGRNLHRAAD